MQQGIKQKQYKKTTDYYIPGYNSEISDWHNLERRELKVSMTFAYKHVHCTTILPISSNLSSY